MPGICFDSTSFLLYITVTLAIMGYLLWKTYQKSNTHISITNVPNVPSVPNVSEGYHAPPNFPESPNMPPYREADVAFRTPNTHFMDHRIPIPVAPYDDGMFNRMGILYHNTNEEYRLPLYGRRDYFNRGNYLYYVIDHTINQNKVALDVKDFLNDGDQVNVPGYPGKFTVHLYDVDFPWFHPNVIGSRGGPFPFKTVYG